MKGDVRPVELFPDDTEESLLKPINKPALHDHSFLVSFLSGKSCLTGVSANIHFKSLIPNPSADGDKYSYLLIALGIQLVEIRIVLRKTHSSVS
jgi:hypothetical protein